MYKLIIIDDEEKIASGMAQLFPWQNIGFEVVQVFTGARKALQYIAENPVDVVLTDIEMPDMNGLELSQRLMEYPNIQKIFFSSYSNYEYFRWPTAPCWNALKRSKPGWMPAAPCRKPPLRPITTRSCTMCSNT